MKIELLKWSGIVSAMTLAIGTAIFSDDAPNVRAHTIPSSAGNRPLLRASDSITHSVYLPWITAPNRCPVLNESYGNVTIISAPTDRPAEQHADLNLALRGYTQTNQYLGLIDLPGQSDPAAPQLPGLFSDNRTGVFTSTHQVYNWDWTCNCRTTPITNPPVTLAGLVTTRTETIRVPSSGYDIGRLPNGYEVMVLYAAPTRLTLKYSREDNVVLGYTLHLENICVDPNLFVLYQTLNATGRTRLPALFAGQGVGTALGEELGVVIRDSGAFMDPRSRKDWWQGR